MCCASIPTGGKAWSFEFRSPVTLKSARISFEATSLAEARAIVQRRRVELSEGKDPNLERKEAVEARRIEHKRAMCAGDALDAYALDFVTGDKVVSRRDRMARLRRAVEPFVTRPVASLTKSDIITRLDEVQDQQRADRPQSRTSRNPRLARLAARARYCPDDRSHRNRENRREASSAESC